MVGKVACPSFHSWVFIHSLCICFSPHKMHIHNYKRIEVKNRERRTLIHKHFFLLALSLSSSTEMENHCFLWDWFSFLGGRKMEGTLPVSPFLNRLLLWFSSCAPPWWIQETTSEMKTGDLDVGRFRVLFAMQVEHGLSLPISYILHAESKLMCVINWYLIIKFIGSQNSATNVDYYDDPKDWRFEKRLYKI